MRICPPFLALVGLVGACLTASVAHAELPSERAASGEAARGAASLERAQAAWNRGEFDAAEVLYREALDQGGLRKKEVLEAYVFMGSARAVQGKKEPALVAFRDAALLDPKFKTPGEAGKKASQLAEVARKQQAKIGQIAFHTEMPQSVAVAQGFPVSVTLDPGHVPLLTRVGLSVNDGLGAKPFVFEQPPGAQLRFNVPGNIAVASARLIVKVVGLDAHDNEVVTAEGHVQVGARVAGDRVAGSTSTSTGNTAHGDTGVKKGPTKSMWSTPWPYVIGGAVLAGAGGAVYFATRPGDQVTVTQVQVQAVR